MLDQCQIAEAPKRWGENWTKSECPKGIAPFQVLIASDSYFLYRQMNTEQEVLSRDYNTFHRILDEFLTQLEEITVHYFLKAKKFMLNIYHINLFEM